MITVISGTNRPDSLTQKVALLYLRLLEKRGIASLLYSLDQLPPDWIHPEMYDCRHPSFQKQLEEFIIPASRFIVIIPEYNGSFPGILKLFLDAADIKPCFHGKKAVFTGIASGRSGNQRGMDQMTTVFHHLKMEVFSQRLTISKIENELDEDGRLKNPALSVLMEKQVDHFLKF